MNMYVAPQDAGQTVLHEYGMQDGIVYHRCTDRSDGTVAWECTQADHDDVGDYWDHAPRYSDYTPCAEPR